MKTQPLSQSLKAEKWGFRLRRVSTQCLTVKFSGSQMKTAKCEGWQWPDIAQGTLTGCLLLGTWQDLRAVRIQGRLVGQEDMLEGTGQLGFPVPSHTAWAAGSGGSQRSPGPQRPGPGFWGRTQLACPPARPFLLLFPLQVSLSPPKSRDASLIPAETTSHLSLFQNS